MTPKKKAIELANKFISKSIFDMTDEELKEQRKQGKVFAIICVKEIVTELNKLPNPCKDMSYLQFLGEVDYELRLL
jgi:hypothetical protein